MARQAIKGSAGSRLRRLGDSFLVHIVPLYATAGWE